jgi:hypothetical protein
MRKPKRKPATTELAERRSAKRRRKTDSAPFWPATAADWNDPEYRRGWNAAMSAVRIAARKLLRT